MTEASQQGLGYSLEQVIQNTIGIPTVLYFDGMKLPSKKPFLLVEQMQNNFTYLSKGREAVETTYRFQIGIFAESHAQRSTLQDKLRSLFLFEEIPLFDDTGVNTGRVFAVNVVSEVPITPEDISDKTRTHRLYFDVEVTQIYHKNRTKK